MAARSRVRSSGSGLGPIEAAFKQLTKTRLLVGMCRAVTNQAIGAPANC